MIYTLTGTVASLEGSKVVVEVAGVGFGVAVPSVAAYAIGAKVTLLTTLLWNQETGPQLFGFSSASERELFILVTNCSGLGPKLALSLLQNASVGQLASALVRGDIAMLSSLKGIGAKKAESLVMQLRTKVEHLLHQGSSSTMAESSVLKDVSDALHALRYSGAEIAGALETLQSDEATRSASFDQQMRRALAHLSRSARH